MRYPCAILFCALMGAVCWTSTGRAEDDSAFRRLAAQRVQARFDFEERELGNFESMPMHWFRIHRDGYPRYSHLGFDTAQKVSGKHSFRIDPNGGSAGVVLEPGVLAAMPGADYLVTARLRTEKMNHARAVMSGAFLDSQLQPVADSQTATPRLVSNGKWTTVWFRLSGRHADAAWIVLRMEVLQPVAMSSSTRNRLDKHQLHYTDINASAWFDDVTVYQLPRIEIKTDSPINMTVEGTQPRLIANARDMSGASLTSVIDVYDMSGRRVDQWCRPPTQTGRSQWSWKPRLPRFGWYWAELSVRSDQDLVGRRQVAFAHLPRPLKTDHPDAERFVISAEKLGSEHRHLLLPLMDKTNGGALVLSAWSAMVGNDPQRLAQKPADPLLLELAMAPNELTLSFDRVPEALVRQTTADPDAPLSLFTLPYDQWRAPFEALLIRYGRTVQRWQIGATGSGASYWHDDLADFYPQLYERFHQYLARPKVALAWQAHQSIPTGSAKPAALTLLLPHAVRPEDIRRYVQTWPTDNTELTLVLQTLPSGPYGHHQRSEDLALRMVQAWQTPVQRLAIDSPWYVSPGHEASLSPDPLLAVWSNVAARLAGRQVVGSISLGRGLRCLVLDGPRGGALVAWNRNADRTRQTVDLYLGEGAEAVDLWGNRTPLPISRDGHQHLTLDSTPVFVEGIDVYLAKLRSSFRIDPSFVRSVHTLHHHTLELTNPYPRSIHGTLHITGPSHWKVGPRQIHFTAQSGQTIRQPLELNFPINELQGEKRITAELDLDGETDRVITLLAPLSLGLKQVIFTPTLHVDNPSKQGRGDVIITALITNLGDEPQTFYAFALAAQRPRLERIVARLEPGQTMLKRFRFINAAGPLSGQTIRTGLREMDGPAILNTTVQVP